MNDWNGKISISATKNAMAKVACEYAVNKLTLALSRKPAIRLLVATGAAQFEFLELLTAAKQIDWERVELFHLDEYIGIPETHPASFVGYIKKRIIDKTRIQKAHLLDGLRDPGELLSELNAIVAEAPIDVAFVGIGENAHLAFNDPPADFDVEDPYLRVQLDETCRKQQVGEGWFASLDAVPKEAFSMSVRQILKARSILCVVPDKRKAPAVKAVVDGPITPRVPASILRTHNDVRLFLDVDSASLLQMATVT
jgi:glucosamine-6-phosphate deaminase